jgi:hypothetical protein
MLTRDAALRQLAARRLNSDRPEELDAATVLLWSTDSHAVRAFEALREEERNGLIGWLSRVTDGITDVVFSMVSGGRAADVLPLGLVCGALWADEAQGGRPQGGALAHIGIGSTVTDQVVKDYAAIAERLVRGLLADFDGDDGRRDDRRRLAHQVLRRADELVVEFGGRDDARHGDMLPAGFEDRLGLVAAALSTALSGAPSASEALPAVAAAVEKLADHALAPFNDHRVRRAQMAQRLIQWLGTPVVTEVGSVGAAVQAHIGEWSWVDRGRDEIWKGEDVNPILKRAYRDIYAAIKERRRMLDEVFARRLKTWTESASGPGDMLTVETVLDEVVAPIVTQRGPDRRPVLLLIADGMSGAVATELAEQIRSQGWEEYDPLPTGGPARRRAVVAALPTVTEVSRASLLSGRLTSGGPDAERQTFESLPLWEGGKFRLFHKGMLEGDAGESLGKELIRTLDDKNTHVAVVLNAIDDSLERGRADPSWKIEEVAGLRTLLDYARYQGRAVIVTSDHGHILEHKSTYRATADAASNRHRDGSTHANDGEVELAGPRVVADGRRIVALWDPYIRYGPRKAGYHGGASLAEVTIPLLAFLPLGAAPPKNWRALPVQRPAWWALEPPTAVPALIDGPASTTPTARPTRRKATTKPMDGQAVLDMPEAEIHAKPQAAAAPGDRLVEELFATELFDVRHRGTPRRVPAEKIRTAVAALADIGGVLPLPVLAERIGEPAIRAAGFAATLGQILNVDNYPVLEVIDGGRNVRLNLALLREQFGLTARAAEVGGVGWSGKNGPEA